MSPMNPGEMDTLRDTLRQRRGRVETNARKAQRKIDDAGRDLVALLAELDEIDAALDRLNA